MTVIAAGKVDGRAATRGDRSDGDGNEISHCRRVTALIAAIPKAQ